MSKLLYSSIVNEDCFINYLAVVETFVSSYILKTGA